MCGSKTTTDKTSNSNTNYSATTTPTVPSWIADPAQGYVGQVAKLVNADPSSFVAGASKGQQAAFTGAQALGGWQDALKQGLGLVGQATSAAAPSYDASHATAATIDPTRDATATTILSLIGGGGLERYMNPELGSVVNTTLAGYDKQAGSDQAALDAQAGLNHAFGGSGFAVQKANLTNNQELGRASTEAGLRSDAFQHATALAGQDAGLLTGVSTHNADATNQRALTQAGLNTGVSTANAGFDNTASAFNASQVAEHIKNLLSGAQISGALGDSQATNARGDVATQLQTGGVERGIDADQRAAPLNLMSTLAQLLGYNPSQFIGQSTSGNQATDATSHEVEKTDPGLLANLSSIMQLGSSLGFSPASFAKMFSGGGGGGGIPNLGAGESLG